LGFFSEKSSAIIAMFFASISGVLGIVNSNLTENYKLFGITAEIKTFASIKNLVFLFCNLIIHSFLFPSQVYRGQHFEVYPKK